MRVRRAEDTDGDAGFTLIEVMVALSIGVVVIVLAMISISTGLFSQANSIAFGAATDNGALAVDQLQRAIANSSAIFNPADEATNAGAGIASGFSLRVLTEQNGATTCMQWRVDSDALQYRSWPAGTRHPVAGWKDLVTGVMNVSTTPPFWLATTAAYGNRLLDVDLDIKASTKGSSTTTWVDSSYTALGAQFSQSTATASCSVIPPA